MTRQMARRARPSMLATSLRALWKLLCLACAIGVWWIAGQAIVVGLASPTYLGIGVVLGLLALGIAVFGWRQE